MFQRQHCVNLNILENLAAKLQQFFESSKRKTAKNQKLRFHDPIFAVTLKCVIFVALNQ